MIHSTKTIVAQSVDPYHNLATEEYLLNNLQPGECTLYLWQNAKTIVIGRNQNVFKECHTEKLLHDGVSIARRLSGGGCVYHDYGNLNFTFLVCEDDYNVSRQLSVIIKALEHFGLCAEETGRNDICIDGRKFSGNAFYMRGGKCYHHGTILVNVDLNKMSDYLSVSAEKLNSKGISSVKSRVVNLKELDHGIDVPGVKASLINAFGEIYGIKPREVSQGSLDAEMISGLYEKYASSDWIYGTHMKADYVVSERFAWGEIEFNIKVLAENIIDVRIFSDSMNADISDSLGFRLKGIPFHRNAVLDAILSIHDESEPEVLKDIYDLFECQEIWQMYPTGFILT